MDFLSKFRIWLQSTGLKNVGYILLFIGALFFQLKLLAGVFLGIFIYINFNVIQKLIRNVINKIDR